MVARVLDDQRDGVLRGHGILVDSFRRERVEYVGDGGDPGQGGTMSLTGFSIERT